MSTPRKIVLVVGLVWCGICALFPPRQYIDSIHDARIIPDHEFLFSADFQIFHYQQGLGNYNSVDVNGGRLLAELVLIAVITGIAFLSAEYFIREFQAMTPDRKPEGGTTCVSCGKHIPEAAKSCPACGWTWLKQL
jgi:hypothetical protein